MLMCEADPTAKFESPGTIFKSLSRNVCTMLSSYPISLETALSSNRSLAIRD